MYNKISKFFSEKYRTIIRLSYIIPILFVAGVSIAHVITWYSMTNPGSWSIYLSIGIEIAALSALAGFAVNAKGSGVYLPFFVVTFIQFIGNIFYAFQFIDINGELFKDWVILTGPILDTLGMVDINDIDSHRRWLSIFSGGLLPLISLSFLHLLVKFNDKESSEIKIDDVKNIENPINTVESENKTDDIKENTIVHNNTITDQIINSDSHLMYSHSIDFSDVDTNPSIEENTDIISDLITDYNDTENEGTVTESVEGANDVTPQVIFNNIPVSNIIEKKKGKQKVVSEDDGLRVVKRKKIVDNNNITRLGKIN